jgi:Holliday junction resolvase RusA-like endonuclease
MKTRLKLANLPPSVNALWRHAKGGKTYRTREYQTWLNGEGWNLKAQMPGQPKWDQPVFITGAFRRPRANSDLDNRLKGIGDLLQDIGALANDKLINGWNVWWSSDLPEGIAADISITSADPISLPNRPVREAA